MVLSYEDVGLKILAKIKIHLLTRAELLCSLSMSYPVNKYGFSTLTTFLLLEVVLAFPLS